MYELFSRDTAELKDKKKKKEQQTWIVAEKADVWRDANADIHQDGYTSRADGAVARSE